MLQWELDVIYYEFPKYEKLLNELRKIPDVIVGPYITDIHHIEGWHVEVYLYDLNKPIGSLPEMSVLYNGLYVEAYIGSEFVDKKEVNNDEEAISVIVDYTRRLLARITGNDKYEKEIRKEADDINKITVARIRVRLLHRIDLDYKLQTLQEMLKCTITHAYRFEMYYRYPYQARTVWGDVFCCFDKCSLFITDESESERYIGRGYLKIDLHGRIPTQKTITQVIAKAAKEIEKIILKYQKKTPD